MADRDWDEGDVYRSATLKKALKDRRPEHFRKGATDHQKDDNNSLGLISDLNSS